MKPLHKILMVSTTFMLAAATGHVMQNPEAFGIATRGAGQPGAILGGDFGLENITPVANVEEPGKAVLVSGLSIEGEAQLPQLPAMRAPQADPGIAALPADPDPETPGFASDCAAPVLLRMPNGQPRDLRFNFAAQQMLLWLDPSGRIPQLKLQCSDPQDVKQLMRFMLDGKR